MEWQSLPLDWEGRSICALSGHNSAPKAGRKGLGHIPPPDPGAQPPRLRKEPLGVKKSVNIHPKRSSLQSQLWRLGVLEALASWFAVFNDSLYPLLPHSLLG